MKIGLNHESGTWCGKFHAKSVRSKCLSVGWAVKSGSEAAHAQDRTGSGDPDAEDHKDVLNKRDFPAILICFKDT